MKINRDLCDICGTCVSVCPVDATIVSEFDVQIDDEECINCLNCLKVCPIKAISEDK